MGGGRDALASAGPAVRYLTHGTTPAAGRGRGRADLRGSRREGRACEWGPSKYELEGPHLAAPHGGRRLPGFLAVCDRPPGAEAATEIRLPGFPVARVSPAFREFPPGRASALAMTEFVLWPGELAQGFPAGNFKIFPGYLRNPQESACYPPGKVAVHRGFHRLVHRLAVAGGRRGESLGGPGPGAPGVRSWPGGGGMRAGIPAQQRGPSTYEVEGPRHSHPAGPPITRLPGCCPAVHRGGKISLEGQFPGSSRTRKDGPVSRAAGVRGSS